MKDETAIAQKDSAGPERVHCTVQARKPRGDVNDQDDDRIRISNKGQHRSTPSPHSVVRSCRSIHLKSVRRSRRYDQASVSQDPALSMESYSAEKGQRLCKESTPGKLTAKAETNKETSTRNKRTTSNAGRKGSVVEIETGKKRCALDLCLNNRYRPRKFRQSSRSSAPAMWFFPLTKKRGQDELQATGSQDVPVRFQSNSFMLSCLPGRGAQPGNFLPSAITSLAMAC